MRRAAVLVTLGLLLIVAPGDAQACSCAGPAPGTSPGEATRATLRLSDGAFIGRLRSIETTDPDPDPGGPFPSSRSAIFEYRVLRSFRARLGDEVRIRSSTSSASCGLSSQRGRKVALALTGRPGTWTAGSCSYLVPRVLRRVAGDRPHEDTDPERGCGA